MVLINADTMCVPGIVAFTRGRICAGKHKCELANACPSQDDALGPLFFVNCQAVPRKPMKRKKNSRLISLFMKATIPGII